MISNRLATLRRKMSEKDINAILVTGRQNVFYLSGFDGSSGDLFITHDVAYVMCDFRYTTQAVEQATLYTQVDVSKGIYGVINNLISYHKITKLAIEDRAITHTVYCGMKKCIPNVYLIPIGDMISSMRAIKDEAELLCLSQSAKIADLAFEGVIKKMHPGMTEIDVAAEIEYIMRKHGARSTSFDTIVASGKNSAKPHGVASNKVIENGDMVVMDFGCVYNGYCSDMTRTVAIGEISKYQRQIYDMVLYTQLKMVNIINEGKKCSEIDDISRNVLDNFGYAKYFGHSLGHGVGIDVHELPTVSSKSDTVLEEGMVVTIEPGVYLNDEFGVRIEDTVIILSQGVKILTNSPKELVII